jgi:2'-5' RNA ligase
MSQVMLPALYAVVTYVDGPLGEFIQNLRRQLHPEQGHVPAHITVLPPRPLIGRESEAIEALEFACSHAAPFEVTLGEVETFIPTTPTVFIRIAHAAYKMRELHDAVNVGPLAYVELLPYMPHMTIAKLASADEAKAISEIAIQRWAAFDGPRNVRVETLTFVRGRDHTWTDLAPFQLGARLVSR